MKVIDVCLSPELVPYQLKPEIVVLTDVIRATSSIVTALANGANHVVMCETIEETLSLRNQGYLLAGERKTLKIEGFDFGNSPIEFTKDKVNKSKLAFCTTNGTYSFNRVSEFSQFYLGALINVSALAERLLSDNGNILILCSGRLRLPALEDMLFAGMLTDILLRSGKYNLADDSAFMAHNTYIAAKPDLLSYLCTNSPAIGANYQRLKHDIDYVIQPDITSIIPVYNAKAKNFSA